MSKMMEYNGYHASFEYDSDDKIFIGKVHGISDSLNFHGSSVEELENMFHQSIDNYLELCQTIGKNPDKEYNGVFNVRIPPEMHKKVSEKALEDETSINTIIKDALDKYFTPVPKETIMCIPYVIPHNNESGKYMTNTESKIKEAIVDVFTA